MKKVTLFLLVFYLIILPNAYILLTSKYYIYKAIYYNFVNIDDYKIFSNRTVPASTLPKPLLESAWCNKKPLPDTVIQTLKSHETVAFMILEDGFIVHESYYDGHTKESISNSFSMAKSVISLLIGAALQDGLVASLDTPIYRYIPEFNTPEKKQITIRHLLQMASGLSWNESKSYQNPLNVFTSDIMEAYYGSDIYTQIVSKPIANKPGTQFSYSSADTELLSFVLSKISGKSVSEYAYEKLWHPLGATSDALWSLDSQEKGREKAYCCLNATARDFARLGLLLLDSGMVNGKSLVPAWYLKEAWSPILLQDGDNPNLPKVDYYGYQFWIMNRPSKTPIIYMRGTLGQLIMVDRELNRVYVHLGKKQGEKYKNHYLQSVVYMQYLQDWESR